MYLLACFWINLIQTTLALLAAVSPVMRARLKLSSTSPAYWSASFMEARNQIRAFARWLGAPHWHDLGFLRRSQMKGPLITYGSLITIC
ncbi:TPA: hypothetical protein ACOENK_000244 [Stenotrophomonas maltophilia]|uniref:hypothetical protein n=1 Tax=Stenotrophomonas maltophilia TaxID=40324 RepID=UPI00117C89F6|nr:hypothetical protein [Stenotrophomonas maltophilia]HDS1309999.1 hypothetical protein [Stenotrophomonas maltophilia]HDS1318914.1 hypothetical protein [Stenotrophomonas maltophilia]HDS1442219.1 hypothetical protein [Stenotrophomonas maltophilia]HDS1539216.1 hypothetical protein [Stenotrophomonas maltophilia]